MADQLAIWNVALAHLGERRLAALTEPREPARVLADEWDAAVRGCLELANWSFATRTQSLNSVGAGAGGFYNAMPKPADWLRTADIAADAALTVPLDGYIEEGGFWYAALGVIWVRYVSTDPNYGYAVARWSQQFADFVALALAARCCRRLTGAADMLGDLVKLRDAASREALTYEEATAARAYVPPPYKGSAKLQVYNDALALLGRARVPSLTQASDTVRELNDQFRGALRWCLERITWNFACNVEQIAANPNAAPRAGYGYAFTKPDDWLRTVNVAVDIDLTQPVSSYVEDVAYWFADTDALTVRYVSTSENYGNDPYLWPPHFCGLLALHLAIVSFGRFSDPKLLEGLVKARDEAEVSARAVEIDAIARVYPSRASDSPQLRIYNQAINRLGLPRIGSLTEASVPVRTLNDEWDQAVRWTLEQGPWTFAIRAVMIGPHNAAPPTFGYQNGFLKPPDWLQTVLVSEYDDFRAGATAYADETGWWFSDAPGLFVRYVSTGPNYGMNFALWPAAFFDVVALRLAEKAAPRLGQPALVASLLMQGAEALKRLRATDALNTPPAFPPEGSWVRARRGGWAGGRRFGAGPGAPSIPLTGDSSLSGDSDLPVGSDYVPRISG